MLQHEYIAHFYFFSLSETTELKQKQAQWFDSFQKQVS